MCHHNLKSKKSTLELLPVAYLTYPPRYTLQCSKCGKVFNAVGDLPEWYKIKTISKDE